MKKLVSSAIVMLAILFVSGIANAQDKKPNILVIWGDDIGYWNVSAYNQGMMGYKTPNIDRIAKEGMLFTDAYGEQSCTAGRRVRHRIKRLSDGPPEGRLAGSQGRPEG
jgi:arylsulfatase